MQKYSVFSLVKNALSNHQNWDLAWKDPTPKKEYDVVILSDYNKGVLENEWFTKIDHDMIIVDPKKSDFSYYSNARIITPNLNELNRASKVNINDHQSIINACKNMLKGSKLEYIVAKKGDKGITIVGKNNFIQDIKAHVVKNPDVTGAGDTVIAVLSLAFFKTNDIKKSTILDGRIPHSVILELFTEHGIGTQITSN